MIKHRKPISEQKAWVEREERTGRPLIMLPDGSRKIPYRRTTRFTSSLDDTYNIKIWDQDRVVRGMAMDPELGERVMCLDPVKDRGELATIRNAAHRLGGGSEAAERGQAVHLMTERLDNDEEPGCVYRGDLAQTEDRYRPGEGELVLDSRLIEEHLAYYLTVTQNIEWLAIESFRVHDSWQIAGTADRIGRDSQGCVRVYDLKTGKNLHPTSMSMQLAMYARMEPYDAGTDQRAPREEGLDLSRGVIIHMPVVGKEAWTDDGVPRCDLWEIDIHKGMGGTNLAHGVWNWRKTRKGELMEQMSPPWEPEKQLEEVG